jgi:dihydropteroate synthase
MDASQRTLLMGVINVTPDSFYDGGRRLDSADAIAHGINLVEAGADIIDIGGESTRPGARSVSAAEELERVLPVIRGLRRNMNVPISIDTYKAEVARAALSEGADIVNDISALRFDPQMVVLVAAETVPVVLMHMQGTPQTMQAEPRYSDVLREVSDFLAARVGIALDAGVERENIIIDPGIGFGKTLEHNLILMRGLPALVSRIQSDGPAVIRNVGDAVQPEGKDEIGQVANAFNEVHSTAVQVAVLQRTHIHSVRKVDPDASQHAIALL